MANEWYSPIFIRNANGEWQIKVTESFFKGNVYKPIPEEFISKLEELYKQVLTNV